MTQEQALDILKTGRNVFLTGAAGSGKTYVLNQYIAYLRSRGVGVAITASTGIAATHIGGTTIHSWCGMGIEDNLSDEQIKDLEDNRRLVNRIKGVSVLIIDEISMLDSARLHLIHRITKHIRSSFEPFGGLQVIVCGDFFQLPPVTARGEQLREFAFEGRGWELLSPTICYLSEQHRQSDKTFLDILNSIRSGVPNSKTIETLQSRLNAPITDVTPARLFSHNVNVDAFNEKQLAKVPGTAKVFGMSSRGNDRLAEALMKSCLAPSELALKIGAAVMFVKNNFDEGVVNGTLGTVIGFDESGSPQVKTKNGVVVANPDSWAIEDDAGKVIAEITQVPLRLAWAMTIHKSQGMSMDAAEIDLSGAFEPGMGYVALSRVRSLSGLRLLGLNDTALMVHDRVSAFDQQLEELSDKHWEEFSVLTPDERKMHHESFVHKSGGKMESEPGEVAKPSAPGGYDEIRKESPSAYKPWRPEDDQALRMAFKTEQRVKVLAEQFGRKPGGIRARLKKLELIS